MDIGVCVASHIGDIDYVVRAEELGYTHAWLADSQMIWSDCYAALALAADRTSKIQLGTGVSVSGTRPAPVTASSIGTINAIAPGRTFLGIGTGNTAMRIMGHKPQRIREFDQYLSALGPLLRGEEAEHHFEGTTQPIRHIMPDHGFVNFKDPIPMYVSGFGPKSLALAGKHGDGAVLSIPPDGKMMERMWEMIERGAVANNQTINRDNYLTCSLTTVVVLDEDETLSSPRVKAEAGAFAMASVHYSYDQFRQYGRTPGGRLEEIWDEYTALLADYDESRIHQRIHAGHNCWVLPEEEQFLTTELIDATCIVGTASQVIERIKELEATGLSQLMILPNWDPRYEVLERVGTKVIPHL
jgi:5,10-methylenetetrahydromethanopterin reductase